MSLHTHLLQELLVTAVLAAACVLIRPSGLAVNNGFSYYGVQAETVLPYSAAFMSYSAALVESSIALSSTFYKHAGRYVAVMIVLLFGILLTPYNQYTLLHNFFAASFFVGQAVFSLMILRARQDLLHYALVALQAVAGVLTIYYFGKPHGLMLESQLLYQVAFSVLVLRFFTSSNTSKDTVKV